MRKIKSERNMKKIKNSINDFYYSWINHPAILEKINKLPAKELKNITSRVKFVVDKIYEEFKVEEKYMYYVNYYDIYELLCVYFSKKNKVLETLEKKAKNDRVSKKIESKNKIDVIENYLGYETAFNNFFNKKADDCLHWMYSSINEILNFYIGRVKDDNVEVLSNRIEQIIKNSDDVYLKIEKNIQVEIVYLNEVLKRIKYAKEHTDIIYSLTPERDKKLRTMIKSSLTRAEKLINLVISEIDNFSVAA